jgi:dsDNA-binding SOS-regulon protein
MAVITKYVVVRDGKDDMIFSTKKEADAYDKMLDIAERLHAFLRASEIDIATDTLDDLTFFMAQHREQIGTLLKGGKLKAPAASVQPATVSPDQGQELSVPETKETKGSKASPSARTTKARAVA